MPDDSFVSAQLTSLASDIRDLRQAVDVKIGGQITRNEHIAEVRRIDAERKALEARHEALEREAAVEHSALRVIIQEYQQTQAQERKHVEEVRKADRRAYIGFIIASIGIIAPIVNSLLNSIFH